jgi:hypothetical protein
MQNGKTLEWVQSNTLLTKNLSWYASCTQNITNTITISLARAIQKQ